MSKGGSGGVNVPKVQVPQGVQTTIDAGFNPLGQYAAQTLPSLLSYANWAGNIATGGNVPSVKLNPSSTSLLGSFNSPTAFDTGALGTTASAPGQGGAPGVQSAGGANGAAPLNQSQMQSLQQAGYWGVKLPNGSIVNIGDPQALDPNAQLLSSTVAGSRNNPTLKGFFGNSFGAIAPQAPAQTTPAQSGVNAGRGPMS